MKNGLDHLERHEPQTQKSGLPVQVGPENREDGDLGGRGPGEAALEPQNPYEEGQKEEVEEDRHLGHARPCGGRAHGQDAGREQGVGTAQRQKEDKRTGDDDALKGRQGPGAALVQMLEDNVGKPRIRGPRPAADSVGEGVHDGQSPMGQDVRAGADVKPGAGLVHGESGQQEDEGKEHDRERPVRVVRVLVRMACHGSVSPRPESNRGLAFTKRVLCH